MRFINYIKRTFPLKIFSFFLLTVLISSLFTGCDSPEEHRFSQFLMDTHVTMIIYGDSTLAEEAKDEAFAEMGRLEALMSRSVEDSDVWRINEKAGKEPVEVDDATIEVVKKAVEYGEVTGGAFDITVAPLLDLWGLFDPDLEPEEQPAPQVELDEIPSQAEIDDRLELVNFRDIEINEEENTVFLPKEGMGIDLGGIAKGYIVDKGIEVLKEAGIEHAFIDGGGDIRALGDKPDDSPWKIGVQDPEAAEVPEQDILGVLPAVDTSVVTSGDYERYVEIDGEKYHHIINPQTGYPSEGLTSVTIKAEDAAAADALSTGVFIMDIDEGIQLVEDLPGVEGVLVTDDMDTEYTSGLEGVFELR